MTDQAFKFNGTNKALTKTHIAKYPKGRQASAVLPLLDLAQRQNDGWLSTSAMDHVATVLDMAPVRVYEVATFYSMYNLKPVGKYHVQVCTTTPCWLRGSDGVLDACKKKLGVEPGGTTADGTFTLAEVECLAACVNAPVAQIGDDYYEDLEAVSMTKILADLAAGKPPAPGPQVKRQTSAPVTGAKTLVKGA